MLTSEQWMDIKDLQRQGLSGRAIARRSGLSRNTVAKVLGEKTPPAKIIRPRSSCLDPYKPYLAQRFQEFGLSSIRLLEEIRPMGYDGSYDVVRRYIQTLAPQKKALQNATVRFETGPGVQAQADWASCGRFADLSGRDVPIYVFAMVLGFSRMLYIEFTTSMDLPTLLRCHGNAFAYFGGWTASILYDNMKQVKINVGTWNALFLDFAGYYGFTPKTHRIRRPRTKGKVERIIDYIKDNFLKGRSFAGLDDLNTQGRHWLEHTANVRIHATTHRRPLDLLGQENLVPLTAIAPYQIPQVVSRKVDRESFVRGFGSLYSVPPQHVGRQVDVMGYPDKIVVRSAHLVIAEHTRSTTPGSCIADEKHIAELWKLALPKQNGTSPAPRYSLSFETSVAVRPLCVYEAAAGCSSMPEQGCIRPTKPISPAASYEEIVV